MRNNLTSLCREERGERLLEKQHDAPVREQNNKEPAEKKRQNAKASEVVKTVQFLWNREDFMPAGRYSVTLYSALFT